MMEGKLATMMEGKMATIFSNLEKYIFKNVEYILVKFGEWKFITRLILLKKTMLEKNQVSDHIFHNACFSILWFWAGEKISFWALISITAGNPARSSLKSDKIFIYCTNDSKNSSKIDTVANFPLVDTQCKKEVILVIE